MIANKSIILSHYSKEIITITINHIQQFCPISLLNLLTFSLLLILPVKDIIVLLILSTVSVLPFIMLSTPFFSFKQLSWCWSLDGLFYHLPSSFSSAEHFVVVLLIDNSLNSSSSSYSTLKYGCSRASSAVILCKGSILNIFFNKSKLSTSKFVYSYSSRLKLQLLFSAKT